MKLSINKETTDLLCELREITKQGFSQLLNRAVILLYNTVKESSDKNHESKTNRIHPE